jgi:D-glycero-D-manno-heptose 1,7-bisphosphate phosphatase
LTDQPLKLQGAFFIDRDGTINVDVGYLASPDGLEIYPGAAPAIRLINDAGLKAVVVTNQSGIARGLYTEQILDSIHDRLRLDLAKDGARIDAIYYCPHHANLGQPPYRLNCDCRKPRPGLLFRAAQEHGIDLSRSYVIGDKASDINLAKNVGAGSALVLTGYGRRTLDNPQFLTSKPDLVAADLLEAVERILDTNFGGG